MRFKYIFIILWALPGVILANAYHVPNDYSLLQSAINASGNGDTIICDTVKDLDTIKIVGRVNLFIKGPSPAILTKITKVVLIKNSICALATMSFAGAKGLDGTNNFSCKSAPGLDGRAGGDAIIIDSSTVAVSQCTARGGDGGTYGISYQGTMLCTCGSKGTPGTALKASFSNISLKNDSLLSGYCAGTSIAGCFTTNCTVQGFGFAGVNHSIVDTIRSNINSISLDSTSTMGLTTKIVTGRYLISSGEVRRLNFVSLSGKIAFPGDFKMPCDVYVYNAEGKLVMRKSNVVQNQFDLGTKPARGIYIISLQRALPTAF